MSCGHSSGETARRNLYGSSPRWPRPFLSGHFATVERRDVEKAVTFAGVEAVRNYIASSVAHKHLAARVPDFEGPFVTTSRQVVFIAERAA